MDISWNISTCWIQIQIQLQKHRYGFGSDHPVQIDVQLCSYLYLFIEFMSSFYLSPSVFECSSYFDQFPHIKIPNGKNKRKRREYQLNCCTQENNIFFGCKSGIPFLSKQEVILASGFFLMCISIGITAQFIGSRLFTRD